jgi:hypothetical protein
MSTQAAQRPRGAEIDYWWYTRPVKHHTQHTLDMVSKGALFVYA